MKKYFFILFSLLLSCQNIPSNNKIVNEKQEKVRLSFLNKQDFSKKLTEKGYEKLNKSKSLEIMNKYKNRGSKDIIINENIKPFLEKNVLSVKGDFPTGPPDENGCIYYSYCYYVCDEISNGYCIRDHAEGCLECDNGSGDGGNDGGGNSDENKELELSVSPIIFSTVVEGKSIALGVSAKTDENWEIKLRYSQSGWIGTGKGDKSLSELSTIIGKDTIDGDYHFELSSSLRPNLINKDVQIDNTKPIFSEPIITESGNGVKFKLNVKDVEKNKVKSNINITNIETEMIIPNMTVSNIKFTELSDKSVDITADINKNNNKKTEIDDLKKGLIRIKFYDKAGNSTEYRNKKAEKEDKKTFNIEVYSGSKINENNFQIAKNTFNIARNSNEYSHVSVGTCGQDFHQIIYRLKGNAIIPSTVSVFFTISILKDGIESIYNQDVRLSSPSVSFGTGLYIGDLKWIINKNNLPEKGIYQYNISNATATFINEKKEVEVVEMNDFLSEEVMLVTQPYSFENGYYGEDVNSSIDEKLYEEHINKKMYLGKSKFEPPFNNIDFLRQEKDKIISDPSKGLEGEKKVNQVTGYVERCEAFFDQSYSPQVTGKFKNTSYSTIRVILNKNAKFVSMFPN